jgi:major type 1 subunit fimbrin (pilin)
MKCNKIALATALVLGLGAIGAANADQGLITFTGSVTDGTCVVSGGTGTNGQTGNFTVPMNPVLSTAFTAAGNVAGLHTFNIKFHNGNNGACAALANGNAVFGFLDSSPNVNAAGRLNNIVTTAQGGATNVDLQLRDASNNVINLSQPATQTFTGLNNAPVTVSYGVEYYATAATVTPGGVRSDLIYNVDFN